MAGKKYRCAKEYVHYSQLLSVGLFRVDHNHIQGITLSGELLLLLLLWFIACNTGTVLTVRRDRHCRPITAASGDSFGTRVATKHFEVMRNITVAC